MECCWLDNDFWCWSSAVRQRKGWWCLVMGIFKFCHISRESPEMLSLQLAQIGSQSSWPQQSVSLPWMALTMTRPNRLYKSVKPVDLVTFLEASLGPGLVSRLVGWSVTLSDYYWICVSGPLQSVHGPRDVIHFLLKTVFFKLYFSKYIRLRLYQAPLSRHRYFCIWLFCHRYRRQQWGQWSRHTPHTLSHTCKCPQSILNRQPSKSFKSHHN